MTEPVKPEPTSKPKRGWFRRALRWAGWLLLVMAIFHRPLFHFTVRFALRQVAARFHIVLDLHTSGTIFTNLVVSGVTARPSGKGPTPVRVIDIERLRLEYSLPRLVQKGVGEFLRSYEMHRATLEFVALPSADKKERDEKFQLAKTLNTLLGQPAAYADRVLVNDFNIRIDAPENTTEVRGVHIFFHPEQEGYLRIARIAVPGVPIWENLAATTSYTNRNLFIRELQLAPELILQEINFDASQRAQNKGSMMFRVKAFGGTAELGLAGEQLAKGGENLERSYATNLRVRVADVSIERALAYFGLPKPPVARLAKLEIDFRGEPEKPRTWDGSLAVRVEGIAAGATKVDAVDLSAAFKDGRANVTAGNVTAGENRVGLTAQAALPESVNEMKRTEVDAELTIAASDLPTLTGPMAAPLGGNVTGGGKVSIHGGILRTELALSGANVASSDLGLGSAKITLTASKQIDPPTESAFDALEVKVGAELNELRFKTFTADSARLDGEALNQAVTLRTFELRRGENVIAARGEAVLPRDSGGFARMPVDARFDLTVPELAAFGVTAGGQTLGGSVKGEGSLKLVGGVLAGGVQIDGSDFRLGEFVAQSLTAKVDVADDQATLEQLTLQIDPQNKIMVTGNAGVAKPFPYNAELALGLEDLRVLQPLLEVFGQKQAIAGDLTVQWKGKGEADPQQHSGDFALVLSGAKYGKTDLKEVNFAGMYTPVFAESKPFRIVTGATSLEGVLEWRERKLRLRDLNLSQAGTQVLSGYLIAPFTPTNAAERVPLNERMAVNIIMTKLDIEKLLTSFGQEAPATGAISANFTAGGTLLQPFAHLKINGERLQGKAAKQFDAATLTADVHFAEKELTLGAVVKQPQIQPLTIKGLLPLDLDATMKNSRIDPKLPIELTVQLPPSSLAFLPKVVPQLRRIDGTAAIDVRVAGTMDKPSISGGAAIELRNARMVSENIPSIGAFHGKLGFAENVLNFQRFDGEVGGGTFKLGGTISLADLKNPLFALRLQSDEVLVKRDDAITIRADTDVKLDGPLAAATVSGTLFVVHSRFFKEIDILPIAVPGRPKPTPKTAQKEATTVSFPTPPLRDWKFDLAIRTRSDDPFAVRGNLANGTAAVNLHLGGTGLAPYLEGSVDIERFVATLPFSKLNITRGLIYFTKDAPFQPTLELQAESNLRNYLVHAYIYGKATEPQVQLSSEPPLPHADLVALLATGTTTAELGGDGSALASRAAVLAVQQLYRKWFKKGAAPQENEGDSDSVLDRFDFELGAVDNRTGSQEVTARFELSKQLYLLGELGVDGNFTGSLKYLIRFR
ncbi:MAG: hypothetical protein JWQ44_2355 [Chthoniobacter sp.]|nr:hypothetical protein [Chthoniobacter sp.]